MYSSTGLGLQEIYTCQC